MTELASALAGAIDRHEISAWFQPQIDLRTGRIVSVEALCRWTHPDFGPIEPSIFIAIAEEVGLIDEIGQFMMDQGCRAAVEWSRLEQPIEVSVNVSPAQLLTSTFTDRLAGELRRMSLPAHSLTVEITESLRIEDLPVVVQRLDELRELGLGVSLDDFGIGHSSMTQLRRLHATELKIDRSLVADDSAETTAMLASIISTVHESGLLVVAEGVETQAHLQRVRELGCDRAQGYLIARPMPERDLVALVA